ncbi:hypothetical protein H5410_046634 [Solanum commersonii]|uniref:Uncharacterized protein n=1 Tax=Solanum commersonii TaxID=4109 RepID=A0A9J5XH01_SOLCO|nr:hypothetical protein H5410_046634 [Solanum commersonii]
MFSSNNKIVGKLCNKSAQYKSITKIFENDERNVDAADLGLNFDKSDKWFVCARKFDNNSPISESWENKNRTYGHPIVPKLELRNNIGSSSKFYFPQDESYEDDFFSDDEFDEHTNIK